MFRKSGTVLLLCMLVLLGGLPSGVHAQSGSVLFVDPIDTLGNLNTIFRVNITLNLTSTETINAYDIQLQYNSSVLKAMNISMGNLFPRNGAQELIRCIDDVGTGCVASDGPGVVHQAVYALGLGNATTGAQDAIVFSVDFNVTRRGAGLFHLFNDTLVNPLVSGGAPIIHLTYDGIFSNQGLAALFNTSPATLIVGRPVYFDASGTFNSTNTSPTYSQTLNYTWNFGDSTNPVSTGANPQTNHVYTAAGKYDVTLTVKDTAGATSKVTKTLLVHTSLGSLRIIVVATNGSDINGYVVVSLLNGSSVVKTLLKSFGDNPVEFSGLAEGTYNVVFAGTVVVTFSKTETIVAGQSTSDVVYLTIKPNPPDQPPGFDYALLLTGGIIGGGSVLGGFAFVRSRRRKMAEREASRARKQSY